MAAALRTAWVASYFICIIITCSCDVTTLPNAHPLPLPNHGDPYQQDDTPIIPLADYDRAEITAFLDDDAQSYDWYLPVDRLPNGRQFLLGLKETAAPTQLMSGDRCQRLLTAPKQSPPAPASFR